MKKIAILAVCGLAACATADPQVNPNEFAFDIVSGEIDGAYNPAGVTRAEVEDQLADVCGIEGLGVYSETPAADGLVNFTGSCRTALFFSGSSYVVRKTRFGFQRSEVPALVVPALGQ